MQSASAPNRRRAAGPATLGEFVLVSGRGARNRDEWMVILADLTQVVVANAQASEDPVFVLMVKRIVGFSG